MSGLRRAGKASYTEGYLRSGAWRERRRRFLADLQARTGRIGCACCDEELSERTADVHHLSYERVVNDDGMYGAGEKDEDLMVLCRWCHERVHAAFDRDRGWARRDRAGATWNVIRLIQRQLLAQALTLAREKDQA